MTFSMSRRATMHVGMAKSILSHRGSCASQHRAIHSSRTDRSMQPVDHTSELMQKKMADYAQRQPTPVTLRELYELGENVTTNTLLLFAQLLQAELPVRLAQRVRDIRRLPFGLSEAPSIQELRELYEQSFVRILTSPRVRSSEQEMQFNVLLVDVKEKHAKAQQNVAAGLYQVMMQNDRARDYDFSAFLDTFYMSRISLRMLIGHYNALHEPEEGMVGIIEKQCSPARIAEDAARDAASLADYYYGMCPEVNVVGATDLRLPYIPAHLYYVMFELLKNSMRASVECHGDASPPLEVVIAEGDDMIAIKIADQGGGIPPDGMSKLWTYSFTTAAETAGDVGATDAAPMAGFGHGLPLSRLYTRYWGGDLRVMSLQGFGTDAYIHIHKLGTLEENLESRSLSD